MFHVLCAITVYKGPCTCIDRIDRATAHCDIPTEYIVTLLLRSCFQTFCSD